MSLEKCRGLFQIDVVVFALLAGLGRARSAWLAHLLWPPSVAWSYYQLSPLPNAPGLDSKALWPSEASFNSRAHTFAALLRLSRLSSQ